MSIPLDLTTDGTLSKNTFLGPRIKSGWLRAILFSIASIFAILFSAIFAIIIIQIFSPIDLKLLEKGEKDLLMVLGPLRMIVFILNQVIGVILVTWFFIAFIDRSSFSAYGFQIKSFTKDFLFGSALGAIFITIGFFILMAGGFLTISSFHFSAPDLMMYFILFVFVALNEEILCRSYLLSSLMHSMNRYVALMITSLLFMLMHMMNANVNLLSTINLFLAGLLLGIYYIYKRNLLFSIGMHITWNFFQGSIFGFAVSGNTTPSIISQELKGSEIINGGKFGFESSILATILIIGLTILVHMKYRNGDGITKEA